MTTANNTNTAATFPKPSNILQFPKVEGFLGNTTEEIQQTLENNIGNWIEQILPVVCSATFNEVSKFGINLLDPMLAYDMLLVQEACRSLMMASLKIKHPFQDLAQEVLEFNEFGGVNIYTQSFEIDEDEDEILDD